MVSFICAWINGWVNNREAGDLRRHRAHYDVIVMKLFSYPRNSFHGTSGPMMMAVVVYWCVTYGAKHWSSQFINRWCCFLVRRWCLFLDSPEKWEGRRCTGKINYLTKSVSTFAGDRTMLSNNNWCKFSSLQYIGLSIRYGVEILWYMAFPSEMWKVISLILFLMCTLLHMHMRQSNHMSLLLKYKWKTGIFLAI